MIGNIFMPFAIFYDTNHILTKKRMSVLYPKTTVTGTIKLLCPTEFAEGNVYSPLCRLLTIQDNRKRDVVVSIVKKTIERFILDEKSYPPGKQRTAFQQRENAEWETSWAQSSPWIFNNFDGQEVIDNMMGINAWAPGHFNSGRKAEQAADRREEAIATERIYLSMNEYSGEIKAERSADAPEPCDPIVVHENRFPAFGDETSGVARVFSLGQIVNGILKEVRLLRQET